MTRRNFGPVMLILAVGLMALLGFGNRSTGENQPAPTATQPPAKAPSAEAAIKAITAEYVKAFNAADAKAAAALWSANGEYIGIDEHVVTGRDAIEKSMAEFFEAHPKATIEVDVEHVRLHGRAAATAEGLVHLKLPTETVPTESRYSALHVLEEDKWAAASVHEWALDHAVDVDPNALEWLVGEWVAKGDAGELRITYAWDEGKAFLNGRYTITMDGKKVSSGLQVIGDNPDGGLRSWMFDNSGTTSHAIWVRDGTRWLSEAIGELPDGTAITSLNIVVPLSHDEFTWQTTDRAVNDVPLPALPPIKVTRVKK